MSVIFPTSWHAQQFQKQSIYDRTRERVMKGRVDFGSKLGERPLFPEPGQTWYDHKTGKTWVYTALDVTALDEIVAAVDDVEVKRFEWVEMERSLGQNLFAAILDEVNFTQGVK